MLKFCIFAKIAENAVECSVRLLGRSLCMSVAHDVCNGLWNTKHGYSRTHTLEAPTKFCAELRENLSRLSAESHRCPLSSIHSACTLRKRRSSAHIATKAAPPRTRYAAFRCRRSLRLARQTPGVSSARCDPAHSLVAGARVERSSLDRAHTTHMTLIVRARAMADISHSGHTRFF